MNDDLRSQTAAAATSLETFRRIAQAHAEREHLLPRRVLTAGGLPAAAAAAALTPGLTASDYMRFALPVRDNDNGDAISGSGKNS